MNAIKMLKELFHDERGQSTVEYILMLSAVVMIALKFKNTFGAKMTSLVDKLGSDITDSMNQQ